MGARTTWMLTTDERAENAIHLYSHWGGGSKLADTREALKATLGRAGDPTYAARIFISQIVGEQWNSELGFGIHAGDIYDWVFEEEYIYIKIDFEPQWVTVGARNWVGTIAEFVESDWTLSDLEKCEECGELLDAEDYCSECGV